MLATTGSKATEPNRKGRGASGTSDVLDMPELYYELTTVEEQERHRAKLARLDSPRKLLIEAVPDEAGGWQAELVTMDWEEPGLLDRTFEAILNCVHVPGGIALRRIRIFTGRSGQVVNILEFRDKQGGPLLKERCEAVMARLRGIQRGERGVLETISNLAFNTLIPSLTEYPQLDNERSEHYTYLGLTVPRLSTRFSSILLHFLARSEFQVNIQLAEFRQEQRGLYSLYVVDKRGRKLEDSHFTRMSMVNTLEAMNRTILRFNLHYVRKGWNLRIERNDATIYRSRPDPADFLEDLESVCRLGRLKGYGEQLSGLVEGDLLDSTAFYFLKNFESFCTRNRERFLALANAPPSDADVELCREYFEQRRRSLRILQPLYRKLMSLEPIRPRLEDGNRLVALCRPHSAAGYALDADNRLYLTESMWLAEPQMAFEPFRLMARTGCKLREDTQDAVQAALEAWTPQFIAERREALGAAFLLILEESLHQGTAALVLRNMRHMGLLQRYLPGFARITGLIHVVADHTYTVDEHSIIAVEALTGIGLLRTVCPAPGLSAMRKDYERLDSGLGLAMYARKYAVEERMLRAVPQLRSHPAIKPFFHLMDEVRSNNLEYIVEMNLLDRSQATSLGALHQIEDVRTQLDALLRLDEALGFTVRRDLVLAALLHDMDKPDPDHGHSFAPRVPETLAAMGIQLPEDSQQRIEWIVRHHLDLTELAGRIGSGGERALEDYLAQCGGSDRLRPLILFTYADRVAVHPDSSQNAHHAMVLSGLLRMVEAADGAAPTESRPAGK